MGPVKRSDPLPFRELPAFGRETSRWYDRGLMDTVTLTIDGRQVTVAKGKTVLQAAIESGIKVPYYCYHPGLGIDGSCRVCIVKIEKMPKLQTSCSTPVRRRHGRVTRRRRTSSRRRAGVFEFLLINHPLDCPVCDKGGECPLQDFSYSFGPDESRMEFPRRVFDGEGVKADVDFGPTLMLNRNRCILCTRCVRFMREVDGDAQISIVDRGYGSEIATFQEEGVHSLLSGNLMDVCPVGAITTRDYRFKSRPWDNPHAVDTICTLCEKGCNTTAWLKAKPEWAKGVAADPHHAALQPGRERLLDVRHRPLRLPLDRRRRAPAAAAAAHRGRHAQQPTTWHDALTRAARPLDAAGRRIRRRCGSCSRRTPRTKSSSSFGSIGEALLGDGASDGVDVALAATREAAAGGHQVHGAGGRRAERARRADLGLARRSRRRQGAPTSRRCERPSMPGSVTALYVFDPGPDGSIGDVALDHRGARKRASCRC